MADQKSLSIMDFRTDTASVIENLDERYGSKGIQIQGNNEKWLAGFLRYDGAFQPDDKLNEWPRSGNPQYGDPKCFRRQASTRFIREFFLEDEIERFKNKFNNQAVSL